MVLSHEILARVSSSKCELPRPPLPPKGCVIRHCRQSKKRTDRCEGASVEKRYRASSRRGESFPLASPPAQSEVGAERWRTTRLDRPAFNARLISLTLSNTLIHLIVRAVKKNRSEDSGLHTYR